LKSGHGGAIQKGYGGRGGRGGRGTPMVGAPPVATPSFTTEAAMAARIEQLEQRLATMASFQHQSHLGGEAPTSYGGDDLFYMASVAQIEASVVVTRSVTRASEPCGATVELDPQRGEAGRQAMLPQSFLLFEVVKTPSMVLTPPIEPIVGPAASTSRAVDTDVSSSVVLRMVTLVLGSPSFSANDLMASKVDLAHVFRLASTLCERESVVATNVEVCEGVDVGQLVAGDVVVEQPVISSVDSPWQATMAKMDTLLVQPTIDCERLTPHVCMLDNWSGIFQLVSPMSHVYRLDQVLLDFGAQPLMLGKATCIGLGIWRLELEPCPFHIQTSFARANDRFHFMTRERLSVQMRPNHATNSSELGVTNVVTTAELYDVLVGGAVLYPMGFQMEYYTKTTTYRPSWQSGDGWMSQVPVRFISGVRLGGSPLKVLASIVGFSGVVAWLGDLLEGNISAIDTPIYEDIKEVFNFVAIMSSSLDIPLWCSSGVLRQDVDRLVSRAWHEAFMPMEEEEVPRWTLILVLLGCLH